MGVARADRVGIFVGEWAPTFFTLGLALAHYEHDDKPLHSVKTEGEWSDLGG